MPKPLSFILLAATVSCLSGMAGVAWSQEASAPRAPEILRTLAEHGFENLAVEEGPDHLTIWFENRKYRYDMTSIGVVAALVSPDLVDGIVLELIPQNRNVALMSLSARAGEWNAFLAGAMGAETFREHLEIRERGRVNGESLSQGSSGKTNRSYLRTDFGLRPLFGFQLGQVGDVFLYTLAVAPEATVSPFHGGLVTLQVAFELSSDFEDPCGAENPCGTDVKPVRNTLSWGGWLPGGWLTAVSGGTFPGDRWGFAGQVGKLYLDGQLEIWAKGDASGKFEFLKDVVTYSNLNEWTAYGAVTHRLSAFDLESTLRAGRFSEGAAAVRIDFERRWSEFELGFFGAKNEHDTTAGITIKIPLPVRKYSNPKRFRLWTVPEFPFVYRDTVDPVAVELSMYDNLDRLRKRLYPTFIRNNLDDLRRAGRYVSLGGGQ